MGKQVFDPFFGLERNAKDTVSEGKIMIYREFIDKEKRRVSRKRRKGFGLDDD